MHDVSLLKHSGDDALDKATIACATGRRWAPVIVDGKATEATWTMGIFWRPQGPFFTTVSPAGNGNLCASAYPPLAIRLGIEGTTTIFYHIATDGSVRDLRIQQSSGSDDLDNATLDCASSWKFYPIQVNGHPVQADKIEKFDWRLGHAPPNQPFVLAAPPLIMVCERYLPRDFEIPRGRTETYLSFRLTAQGLFQDVSVLRSSRNATLDEAARRCMAGHRTAPISIAGSPAEVTWVMGYFWWGKYSTFSTIGPQGEPHICDESLFGARPNEGMTTLAYHIDIDGKVKDLTVKHSSGSDEIDEYAKNCVSAWSYVPVKTNGKPVQVDMVMRYARY
jgi:TonB family protein